MKFKWPEKVARRARQNGQMQKQKKYLELIVLFKFNDGLANFGYYTPAQRSWRGGVYWIDLVLFSKIGHGWATILSFLSRVNVRISLLTDCTELYAHYGERRAVGRCLSANLISPAVCVANSLLTFWLEQYASVCLCLLSVWPVCFGLFYHSPYKVNCVSFMLILTVLITSISDWQNIYIYICELCITIIRGILLA